MVKANAHQLPGDAIGMSEEQQMDYKNSRLALTLDTAGWQWHTAITPLHLSHLSLLTMT